MSGKSQIETRKQYKNKETPTTTASTKNKTGAGTSSTKAGGKPKPTEDGGGKPQPTQENQQGATVYLEPCDYEKPTIKHPVSVGKALNSKGIKTYTEIAAVGKFRFKVEFGNAQEAKKLTEANMEELNLKCYVPVMLKQTMGLAKGIPEEYSEQELMENLEAEVEITKVERMKKRDRNKKLVDTENVKITFRGKELPDSVSLYGCGFKIELYLFPVKQCANCWAFGHRRDKCWRSTKCRDCGEEHSGGNCKQKACINCGGPHSPTDNACPEKAKQVRINAAMQLEKITYKEAKDKWRQENQFDLLSNFDDEFPETMMQGPTQKNPSSGQYRYVWTRSSRSAQQKGTGGRQTTYAEKVKEKQQRFQFVENPYKSTLLERTMMELKHFWRNLNLVRKLMNLQSAINSEVVGQAASEVNLEDILIRISSSLNDIIQEFTEDLAECAEIPSKETEESQTPNHG